MSDCVEWAKYRNPDGYGQKWDPERRTMVLAHRAAWQEAHGPIPYGLNVLHRCDNPPCVNVEHLFLGTHADNMADMVAKGRSGGGGASGERNGMAKLTPTQAGIIRSSTEPQRVLAARFGVSGTLVGMIRRGEIWKV